MTAEDFRRLALQFPNVVESSHMHHPDFRVGGRIFATLGHPGVEFATSVPASRPGNPGRPSRPSRLSRPIRTDRARSAGRARPRH